MLPSLKKTIEWQNLCLFKWLIQIVLDPIINSRRILEYNNQRHSQVFIINILWSKVDCCIKDTCTKQFVKVFNKTLCWKRFCNSSWTFRKKIQKKVVSLTWFKKSLYFNSNGKKDESTLFLSKLQYCPIWTARDFTDTLLLLLLFLFLFFFLVYVTAIVVLTRLFVHNNRKIVNEVQTKCFLMTIIMVAEALCKRVLEFGKKGSNDVELLWMK